MAAVAELAEMAIEGHMGMEDPDYCYVEGSTMDCIFYYLHLLNGLGFYFLHHFANPIVLTVPNHFTDLCCCTTSLLLSLPYRVWNPFNSQELRPIPPRDHPDRIPRVLVAYPVGDGYYSVFHIVCALPSARFQGAHYFDVFSSDTNQWHLSDDEHFLGRIKANTGVPCGRKAYWLTETPSVVRYDTEDGTDEIICIPCRFWDSGIPYHMQLGTRGEDLCLVKATEVELDVYIMEADHQQWYLRHRVDFVRREVPVPMRFQSDRLQVLFWADGRLFMLEEPWEQEEGGGPLRFHIRSLLHGQTIPPEFPADVLPHVHNAHMLPYSDFPVDPMHHVH